jgi:hypothetical protein
MMKCKMPKFLLGCLISSEMPIFLWGGWGLFNFLDFFWPLKAKIQNGEWIPFCQKICMVFSSILQNDMLKPKNFWVKWGTKHTLNQFLKRITV